MAGAQLPFDSEVLIPGPAFDVDLAAFDACHPVHYSRRLLFFHCPGPSTTTRRDAQFAALKSGLARLVARCPLLAGTVAAPSPVGSSSGQQQWRTIVPGPGLALVTRDLCQEMPTMADLEAQEFPMSMLPYEALMPVPEDLDGAVPYAACKVPRPDLGTYFTPRLDRLYLPRQ